MPHRPKILLSLLTLAAIVSACGDATRTTQPSSITPNGDPSRDLVDPTTCRTGYNSSTGRCD